MRSRLLVALGLLLRSVTGLTWKFNQRNFTLGLVAIGWVCGGGLSPACAITAAYSILGVIASSIYSGDGNGLTGTTTRGLGPITHYHPDGAVYNFLNTSALDVNIWHTVQNGPHTLRAMKGSTGKTIVTINLSANGLGSDKDPISRRDDNDIRDLTAVYGDTEWPVSETISDDDLMGLATTIIDAQADSNLNVEVMCSTATDMTNADTFDVAWLFTAPSDEGMNPPDVCGA